MQIRKLKHEDFEASKALSEYAFQYVLAEEKREEERNRFRPEETWGAFEGEQLQAKLTIIPLQLYMNGKRVDMGGIAGVATWPEQRRKGFVSSLITNALQVMKDNGQTISALSPFSFAFYRRYGWEHYIDHKRYTIETAMLPARHEVEGRVERRNGDIALLNEVYSVYASRYNGTLVRTEDWWKYSVLRRKKGHTAFYYQPNGTTAGYLLYEVANSEMTIHELVALDETARKALWSFVANHDSMIQRVYLTAPADDNLPFLLPNPRIKQEIIPYFMARIVDLAPFIGQYEFVAADQSAHLSIQVIDSFAPWNAGTWIWTIDRNGTANLEPCGSDGSEVPDIGCDIQTLTAMLFGYKRPGELLACGRLSATPETVWKLERSIPRKATYFSDFF